jgi:hypothetical protein
MPRLLVVLAVFSTVGCQMSLQNGGDDSPDAGTTSATCTEAKNHSDLAWIQDNVFTKSCTFSGCHRGTASGAGFLNLETGMSHTQLVNQPAKTETGWMRVTAGTTSTSYLLVAIGAATGPKPTDGVMPLGSPPLCQEKLDAIKRWVEQGAKP